MHQLPKVNKVFHIVRRFARKDWGGTESVVYHLSEDFEKSGIPSPVLTTDMLSVPGTENIGKIQVRRFPYIFPWFGLSDTDKKKMVLKGGNPLCFELFNFLKKQKDISIVHTHVQHRLGGIARTIARRRNIPYVVSLHGGNVTLPADQVASMKEPFKGKIEWGKVFGALWGSRRVLKDADAIVCVGRDEYELMQKKFPDKEVVYQANGVDVDFFRNAPVGDFREKYGVASETKLILNVSRIDPQKNQLLLLKAFADYHTKYPESKLVLIGPVSVESYKVEIEESAKEFGVDHSVIFIDGLEPSDPLLGSAYKEADIFVLPSMYEPFGIVILEAWAAGTPVIAANVGGIPGFTHDGKDLLLFDCNNQEQLVEKMQWITEDSGKAGSLRKNALQEVEKYDWSIIARQTLELYQRLIAKKLKG